MNIMSLHILHRILKFVIDCLKYIKDFMACHQEEWRVGSRAIKTTDIFLLYLKHCFSDLFFYVKYKNLTVVIHYEIIVSN